MTAFIRLMKSPASDLYSIKTLHCKRTVRILDTPLREIDEFVLPFAGGDVRCQCFYPFLLDLYEGKLNAFILRTKLMKMWNKVLEDGHVCTSFRDLVKKNL